MTTSPTQRSLALLRSENYEPQIVERYNSFSRTRSDLYGWIDILAIHKETGDVLVVQTTSATNVSSRMNKITASEHLSLVRKAGWSIEVHGWKRGRNGRYTVRRENLS